MAAWRRRLYLHIFVPIHFHKSTVQLQRRSISTFVVCFSLTQLAGLGTKKQIFGATYTSTLFAGFHSLFVFSRYTIETRVVHPNALTWIGTTSRITLIPVDQVPRGLQRWVTTDHWGEQGLLLLKEPRRGRVVLRVLPPKPFVLSYATMIASLERTSLTGHPDWF